MDKWEQARLDARMKTKTLEGKTIASVLADTNELTIKFTDGTILEISCFIEQGQFSDHAELEYELTQERTR
jgi:hypothetical protein